MRITTALLSTPLFSSMGSKQYILNPCQQVKESCYAVSKEASFVHIDQKAIGAAAASILTQCASTPLEAGVEWDKCKWHFTDGGPLTCQYVFVMDSLNFCFWPVAGLEYDTLAMSLKNVLEADNGAFDASRLAEITEVPNAYSEFCRERCIFCRNRLCS